MQLVGFGLAAMMVCLAVVPGANAETPPLTLNDAIARAVQESPRMKAANAALEAANATRDQAGLWANPEIGFTTENISGSGPYRGMDGAENTIALSQKLEIGGKISGRVEAAEQAATISRLDADMALATLVRDTKVAYADTIAAQEMMALAAEQKALAKELVNEVGERVGAAREPLIQSSKAAIPLATAEVAHLRASREADHARHVLASLWSGHDETLTLDISGFFIVTPPPSELAIEAQLEHGLDMTRMKMSEQLSKAQYALEKANAIPDPTISAGARQLKTTNDQAFLLSVSWPLPVLNRNQGNIARAQADIHRSESETHATQLALRNEAFEARETMENAYHHASKFNQTILPAAEKSFRLARQGYRLGRFPYLEVLDAQRTLYEVKEQRIATLNEYHKAKAELERLTTPVSSNHEGQSNAQ